MIIVAVDRTVVVVVVVVVANIIGTVIIFIIVNVFLITFDFFHCFRQLILKARADADRI